MVSVTPVRYRAAQRWLHWLAALLVLVAYVAIEFRGEFPRGSAGRFGMMQSHFWAGLAIVALLLPRALMRLRHGAPPITPPLPAWQAWPAGVLHVALYAFLLVQPLLGLGLVWSEGRDVVVPLLGVALPAPIAPDEGLAETLEELHETIGELFYWVIGAHVLATLYHHFIRHDDTLRRMR